MGDSLQVLITGGGGLVGQALAKRHVAAGDSVCILDSRVNKYNDYSKLIGVDVSTTPLTELFRCHQFDVVSHQAALVGVGQSQYDVAEYVKQNIQYTAELIQAMIDASWRPSKVLFAGSMGPYGDTSGLVAEAHPRVPESIYGVTKLAQEELLRVFAQTYNVPTMALRYFSVYATDQSPLNPYTGVLSVAANQLLNSEHVEFYEDGTQYRDLIHVDDVAEAHFVATRTSSVGFEAYNVGTGQATTISYVVERMRSQLSPNKRVLFNGKHRAGDIHGFVADNHKLCSLGWKPQVLIDAGINDYCRFIQANRDKFTTGDTIRVENAHVEQRGLVRC